MKITIIPLDGAVYKDGVSFTELDLSSVPSNIHALQWDDNKGWIEFSQDGDLSKPTNENITELPEWVSDSLLKWEDANTAFIAAQAAALQVYEDTIKQQSDTLQQ